MPGMENLFSAKGHLDFYIIYVAYKIVSLKISLLYLVKPLFSQSVLKLVQHVHPTCATCTPLTTTVLSVNAINTGRPWTL